MGFLPVALTQAFGLVCNQSTDDMAFDVSWFAVHSFGLDKAPVLLSSLDRKGIVTTAERDWKSELSLERVSVLEFLLQVHGSEDQDFGNYYCSVTPWVKSPTGSWQKEAEIYSKPIFVTVKMDGKNDMLFECLCHAATDGFRLLPFEECATAQPARSRPGLGLYPEGAQTGLPRYGVQCWSHHQGMILKTPWKDF